MKRPTFRTALKGAILVGVGAAAWNILRRQPEPLTVSPAAWPPLPVEPGPTDAPLPAAEVDQPAWVDAVDGECPPTHPVKAKLSSGIYHLPGMLNYERTSADRCYTDQVAAESDGLRPAKL